MKRVIAVIMSAVLAISCAACGGSSGNKPADTPADNGSSTEVTQPATQPAESDPGQTAEPSKPADDGAVTADGEIAFDVLIKRMETEEQFKVPEDSEYTSDHEPFPYGYVSYPEFKVPDSLKKSYPALAKTLNGLSMDYYERAVKTLAEEAQMGSEMAQYGDTFFSSNEENWEPYFYRADDNIVSCIVSEESWYNGPHPFTDFSCVAIDPKNGERIPFSDIFTDMFPVAEFIFNHLENIDGEYDFSEDRSSIYPTIESMIENGDIVWALGDDGLHVQFNAYQLMYYAFGPITSFISYEELGDLLDPKYALPDKAPKTPLADRIKVIDETGKNVEKWPLDKILRYYEPEEEYYEEGDAEVTDFYISCPDWSAKPYAAPGVTDPIGESLITLTEVDKKSSDWLDQAAWSNENGIPFALSFYTAENNTYDDGSYTYYTDNSDYSSLVLEVRESTSEALVGRYDFSGFMNTPNPGNEFTDPGIPFAVLMDGVLYVEITHRTYSEDQPDNAYIVAVNAYDGSVIWRSDMLVANGNNFLVIDDQIVCGYGFTAEDDYVYILSRHNGAVLNRWKVKSGPDQFIRDDAYVYVLTYNTAYKYELSFG